MAFTNFTIEGDAVLGYFADEPSDRDRAVRIKDDSEGEDSIGIRIENLIAKSLNFPNDAEFQSHFEHMEELRQQELQPADGTPDIIREGTRLRVTVEVIEN